MKRLVLGIALLAGLVAAARVVFHAFKAEGAISSVDQNQERLAHHPSSLHQELSTDNEAARGYQSQLERIAQQLSAIAHDLRG